MEKIAPEIIIAVVAVILLVLMIGAIDILEEEEIIPYQIHVAKAYGAFQLVLYNGGEDYRFNETYIAIQKPDGENVILQMNGLSHNRVLLSNIPFGLEPDNNTEVEADPINGQRLGFADQFAVYEYADNGNSIDGYTFMFQLEDGTNIGSVKLIEGTRNF